MPAEELSRLIDRELGHKPAEAAPGHRASGSASTSWVARHLAAASREASLAPHRRSLRCVGAVSRVAAILAWFVLAGVLVVSKFTAPRGQPAPPKLRQLLEVPPAKKARTLAPFRAPAHPRAALPCTAKMNGGQPFLFQSPERPDRKAFLCLNQKAGSTTWELALLRAGPHIEYHDLTISPHGHKGRPAAPAEPNCGEHSEDAAVPRFMLVRNPYSRLLSGFMDKCVQDPENLGAENFPGNMDKVCKAGLKNSKDAAATFPKFVEAVITEDPDRLNLRGGGGHWSLLSTHCHIEAGFDYYLPTEQIAHWYEPFVAALDLGETVRTGWNVSTKWWHNDGSECFYHPPGLGCDGAPLSTAGAGPLAMGSNHATGSDARMDEFYTPELARAVSEWAKADLEEFGYPAWDGVDGAGYLRRISTPGRN